MKKYQLLVALTVSASLFCANVQAQEIIINESFDQFSEGSETEPATTDISGYSGKLYKTLGWNGRYVYEAGGMLKINDNGNLKTPYLKQLTASTNIKVTFDVKSAAPYGGG